MTTVDKEGTVHVIFIFFGLYVPFLTTLMIFYGAWSAKSSQNPEIINYMGASSFTEG